MHPWLCLYASTYPGVCAAAVAVLAVGVVRVDADAAGMPVPIAAPHVLRDVLQQQVLLGSCSFCPVATTTAERAGVTPGGHLCFADGLCTQLYSGRLWSLTQQL